MPIEQSPEAGALLNRQSTIGNWNLKERSVPAAAPAGAAAALRRYFARRSPRAAFGTIEDIVANALGDRRHVRDLVGGHAQFRQRLAEELDNRIHVTVIHPALDQVLVPAPHVQSRVIR